MGEYPREEEQHDWATEIRTLLIEDYSEGEHVILACDNLDTHICGALYEAFPQRGSNTPGTPRNPSYA